MPIDPFHLDPDRRQPQRPAPRSIFHPLHIVGLVVIIIAALAAAWVWGDKPPTVVYLKAVGAILGLVFLWRLKCGWDDDGIVGLWYFWHQPWGSSFAGDDPGPRDQDPLASTIWWTGIALTIFAIAAAARAFL